MANLLNLCHINAGLITAVLSSLVVADATNNDRDGQRNKNVAIYLEFQKRFPGTKAEKIPALVHPLHSPQCHSESPGSILLNDRK